MSESPPARLAHAAPPVTTLVAAFAAIYLIWGSTYLAIRWAVESLPPFLMAGTRFLVAGLVLLAWTQSRKLPLPTVREWGASTIAGGLLLLGGNGGVVWAEQWLASGTTALLIAAVPFWMVLLEWASPARVRPSAWTLLGLATGLIGVWLLVGDVGAGFDRPELRWGALAVLVAGASWAAGSLYGRSGRVSASPWVATAAQMIAGGALLLVLAGATGEVSTFSPGTVALRSWLSLGYLVIAGSLVAFTAYVWLMRVTTATAVSTYAYVNPAVALFLGWAFADEVLTPRVLLASSVILISVLIVHRSRTVRRPPATPVPPAPVRSS